MEANCNREILYFGYIKELKGWAENSAALNPQHGRESALTEMRGSVQKAVLLDNFSTPVHNSKALIQEQGLAETFLNLC